MMSSDASLHAITDSLSRSSLDSTVGDVVSDPRRLEILALLDAREGTMSLPELVAALGADERNAVGESDASTRRMCQVELVHDHLPRLADHGAIEWDRERGLVGLAPAASSAAQTLSAALEEHSVREVGMVLETTRHPVRAGVLETLESMDTPCSLETLATTLVERNDVEPTEPSRVATELHHVHLPLLDERGVLEYDPSSLTVQ